MGPPYPASAELAQHPGELVEYLARESVRPGHARCVAAASAGYLWPMSENLRDLAAELTRVDTAIHDVPLYADPSDPTSSFSEELIELVAREEELVSELIRQARQEIADDQIADDQEESVRA